MKTRDRGAAIVTAMLLMGFLAFIVVGVLLVVSEQRKRNIEAVRSSTREGCSESGLQLARAYFARNFASWNTYLATPSVYNPLPSTFNATPATPRDVTFQGNNPQLFADLDGDGALDVYIFIRDNADEGLPAAEDWTRDNDQNVLVGAVCISRTMVPRKGEAPDPDLLIVEGLLSFNLPNNGYGSQSLGSSSGSGNTN